MEDNSGTSPRLPFAATRVVRASRELSPAEKLVWLELWSLDRGPDGAWIGAAALGSRLGLHVDSVKHIRTGLQAIGLLRGLQQRRGERAAWLVQLPCECMPSARRVEPSEVERRAAALDLHITQSRGSGEKTTRVDSTTTPREVAVSRHQVTRTAKVGVVVESPPLPAQTRVTSGGDISPTLAPPHPSSLLQYGEDGVHPPPPSENRSLSRTVRLESTENSRPPTDAKPIPVGKLTRARLLEEYRKAGFPKLPGQPAEAEAEAEP